MVTDQVDSTLLRELPSLLTSRNHMLLTGLITCYGMETLLRMSCRLQAECDDDCIRRYQQHIHCGPARGGYLG